jgi:hypothetical protein
MPNRLVLRERPLPGESIHSLLIRFATLNKYSVHTLYGILRDFSPSYEYDNLFPDLTLLHHATALSIKTLGSCSYEYWSAMAQIKGLGFELLPYKRAQYCPKCLRVDQFHRVVWMPACVITCVTHNIPLQRVCPGCEKFVSIKDVVMVSCHHCRHDLRLRRSKTKAHDDMEEQTVLQDLLCGNNKVGKYLKQHFSSDECLLVVLMFKAVLKDETISGVISLLENCPSDILLWLRARVQNNSLKFYEIGIIHCLLFDDIGRFSYRLVHEMIADILGVSQHCIDDIIDLGFCCEKDGATISVQSFLATFHIWDREVSIRQISKMLKIPISRAKILSEICLLVGGDLKVKYKKVVKLDNINWQLIFIVLEYFSLRFIKYDGYGDWPIEFIFPKKFILDPPNGHEGNRMHMMIGKEGDKIEGVSSYLSSFIRNYYNWQRGHGRMDVYDSSKASLFIEQ